MIYKSHWPSHVEFEIQSELVDIKAARPHSSFNVEHLKTSKGKKRLNNLKNFFELPSLLINSTTFFISITT